MKLSPHATLVLALGLVPTLASAVGNTPDFGLKMEALLKKASQSYFGIDAPLMTSAVDPNGEDVPTRSATDAAADHITLAKGLEVRYLTRDAANSTDMFAFWPLDGKPTHLITCIEVDRENLADGRLNPGVQRISLADGKVETVLRGLQSCDGIRTTPWGTILATEEEDDGGAYEILDPAATTDVSVVARNGNDFTDASGKPVSGQVAWRNALATLSWEGLHVYPNGVVYFGDELRPGTDAADADGGAVFKFVPTIPRNPKAGKITSLDQSPLVSGTNYAMQISCVNSKAQFGQGCEVGGGTWIEIKDARAARLEADQKGATGYYRPEDLHGDTRYSDKANPNAVRFCWTNTGNMANNNYGEVFCAVDADSAMATSKVVANRFIEGDAELNQPDNLEFQPVTGNTYVIEDNPNGDVWACLKDGKDRDIKSDGCARILSVIDASAEPTGFMFTPDGSTAYVSIQHSDDTNMPLVDGYPTDDVLVITGFKTGRK